MAASTESVSPQVPAKNGGNAGKSFARTANWTVGLAAAILVIISVGGYFYHREQLAALATAHLRLIVTGPSALQAGVPAEYTISTSAIGGQPLPSQVEVALLTPEGKRLKAYQETTDERGRLQVAIPGELSLPPQVRLMIVAVHGDSREEVETPLAVDPVRYATHASTDKPLYQPGETVYYRSLTLSRFGLAAEKPMPVHFEILDPSGAVVPRSQQDCVTERGVGNGAFTIPDESAGGQYTLVVRSPQQAIPEEKQTFFIRRHRLARPEKELESARDIDPGKVDVTFYPEGGDLVAGLENRVYFVGRNPLGKPVHVSGAIVAGGGPKSPENEVGKVQTLHEGMGVFTITPRAGESYRLKITRPAGVQNEPKLPAASAERKVSLTTGSGVFAPAAPLEFNVRAAKPGLPLVAAAYCRGVQVGEQPLVTKSSATGANPVAIPLDAAVGGVIRLAVYDYSASPPQPVAERLVYRRPAHRLNIRAVGPGRRYSPGEKVSISLLVTNEKGEPAPATLGVAVVDDALFSPANDRTPGMATRLLLTGEIEKPEDLEKADFYLSEGTKGDVPAAVGLDLLLGTRGWRRFAELGGPPIMFDNIGRIRDDYEKRLVEYRADRTKALNTLTTASFFGGLGLVLLVAMLGLMRIVSGMHLWIPAIGATTCCLIVGAILMDPGRLTPGPDVAVAFSPYHATTAQPAAPAPQAVPGRREAPEKTSKDEQAGDDSLPCIVRQYAHQHVAGQPGASDLTETLFWHPLLIASPDGKASISFELSDAATTFRVLADAHGDGRIGSGQAEIISRISSNQ
jgi:hypothetical protein